MSIYDPHMRQSSLFCSEHIIAAMFCSRLATSVPSTELSSDSIWNTKCFYFTIGIWNPTLGSSDFKCLFMCMSHVLDPIIWIPDWYKRRQNGNHFPGIQMVKLSSIQLTFKSWKKWNLTSFQPFEYQTSLIFRSPLYLKLSLSRPKKVDSSNSSNSSSKPT